MRGTRISHGPRHDRPGCHGGVLKRSRADSNSCGNGGSNPRAVRAPSDCGAHDCGPNPSPNGRSNGATDTCGAGNNARPGYSGSNR